MLSRFRSLIETWSKQEHETSRWLLIQKQYVFFLIQNLRILDRCTFAVDYDIYDKAANLRLHNRLNPLRNLYSIGPILKAHSFLPIVSTSFCVALPCKTLCNGECDPGAKCRGNIWQKQFVVSKISQNKNKIQINKQTTT